MARINTQIFFLFLFWYCLKAVQIHGATEEVPPHFHLVIVRSLKPKPYCQRSSSGPIIGSQKLKIISRNGPCYSNATGKKISSSDHELFHWDEVRVRSINKRSNEFYSNSLQSQHEHVVGPKNGGGDHGEYVVKIGLGTPKTDFHLEMDTVSEWTWVRCKPCAKGCKSKDPLYDPSKSSTYIKGACKGMTGSGDEAFIGNYGDNSTTRGVWGCDTLTIEDFGVTSNFQFGCGQDNFDNTHNNFGGAAGILGLGRGDYSLPSQTASTLQSVQMFSYCLPLTNAQMGNLYFGDEAKTKSISSSLKFTPLLKGDKKDYYYVDLVGISVAGKKLNVRPSTMFTSRGTIIDSGTVITRLPRQVYYALRDAFRKSMLKYTLIKAKDKVMDTCYSTRGYKTIALPEITLHFGGRTYVTLTTSGTIWVPKKGNVMCLAFAATDDLSIIGNVQQRGLNVLYDLQGERIGFGSDC